MRLSFLAGLALLAASPVAAQEFTFFQSPTGNISCMLQQSSDWNGARCDLREAQLSFPRRPANCEQDWGQAFVVGARGSGTPICHGDTVANSRAPVLNYGSSISLGGVTCTSEQTGMTCRNSQGHGFIVARARQSVF